MDKNEDTGNNVLMEIKNKRKIIYKKINKKWIIWKKVTNTEDRQRKFYTKIICIPEVNTKAIEKNKYENL